MQILTDLETFPDLLDTERSNKNASNVPNQTHTPQQVIKLEMSSSLLQQGAHINQPDTSCSIFNYTAGQEPQRIGQEEIRLLDLHSRKPV